MPDRRQPHSAIESLTVGREIPELTKYVTLRTLVRFACASNDFYEIHYDEGFARAAGLPGVIVHGSLKAAYLSQLVSRWSRQLGRLVELRVTYRGIDFPNQPYRCRAVVRANDGDVVELEVWGENPEGIRTAAGFARVRLAKAP